MLPPGIRKSQSTGRADSVLHIVHVYFLLAHSFVFTSTIFATGKQNIFLPSLRMLLYKLSKSSMNLGSVTQLCCTDSPLS